MLLAGIVVVERFDTWESHCGVSNTIHTFLMWQWVSS